MKLKIFQLICISVILAVTVASIAAAQEGALTPTRPGDQPATTSPSGQGNQTENVFFQPVTSPTQVSKITLVQNLPKTTWTMAVANIIKLVLQITGSLAFASFTVGGILMVIARGDETQYKKGKDIIFWSITALIIIAASYAIVLGVTNLKFFQ